MLGDGQSVRVEQLQVIENKLASLCPTTTSQNSHPAMTRSVRCATLWSVRSAHSQLRPRITASLRHTLAGSRQCSTGLRITSRYSLALHALYPVVVPVRLFAAETLERLSVDLYPAYSRHCVVSFRRSARWRSAGDVMPTVSDLSVCGRHAAAHKAIY